LQKARTDNWKSLDSIKRKRSLPTTREAELAEWVQFNWKTLVKHDLNRPHTGRIDGRQYRNAGYVRPKGFASPF